MAVKTWAQSSGNNWSTGANWGGSVPALTDSVTFSSSNVANCTIDNVGTWDGGTFTISSGYTGTITLSVGTINTAAFSQAGGTFTSGGATALTCSTFSLTGGSYSNPGGTSVTGQATLNGASTTTVRIIGKRVRQG